MGLADDIAKGMRDKKKKPASDEEEGTPEEEATEPEAEAKAEGDEGGESSSDDAEMSDYDSVEDSAVADLMSTKDPKTFKAALRDFVKACMDRDEEGEY